MVYIVKINKAVLLKIITTIYYANLKLQSYILYVKFLMKQLPNFNIYFVNSKPFYPYKRLIQNLL